MGWPAMIFIAGAAGGNIAGAILRNFNLGLLRNSIYGALGGYLGAHVAMALAGTAGLAPELGVAVFAGGLITALLGALMNLADR